MEILCPQGDRHNSLLLKCGTVLSDFFPKNFNYGKEQKDHFAGEKPDTHCFSQEVKVQGSSGKLCKQCIQALMQCDEDSTLPPRVIFFLKIHNPSLTRSEIQHKCELKDISQNTQNCYGIKNRKV